MGDGKNMSKGKDRHGGRSHETPCLDCEHFIPGGSWLETHCRRGGSAFALNCPWYRRKGE